MSISDGPLEARDGVSGPRPEIYGGNIFTNFLQVPVSIVRLPMSQPPGHDD